MCVLIWLQVTAQPNTLCVCHRWVESKGIVKSLLASNALQRYYLHLLEQSRGGVPIPPISAAMAKVRIPFLLRKRT